MNDAEWIARCRQIAAKSKNTWKQGVIASIIGQHESGRPLSSRQKEMLRSFWDDFIRKYGPVDVVAEARKYFG